MRNRAGFTLSEMVITVAVFSLVIGAPAALFASVNRTFTQEAAIDDLDRLATRIIDQVAERVQSTSAASITPAGVTAPLNTRSITFQRGTGYANGAIVLGNPERIEFQYTAADPDDGQDNDGDGLVDEGRVVLIENPGLPGQRTRVLGESVREGLEGEVQGNGVDDNGNGLVDESGLSFDIDKERMNIWLTLERQAPDGALLTRTIGRTIAFRNHTP